MQKARLLLTLIMAASAYAEAANLPCSGSKDGIARCDGAKFLCNDGTYSASTQDCRLVFNPTPTCISPQVLQNGVCITPTPQCLPPKVIKNGQCVLPEPVCIAPNVLENGVCKKPDPVCIAPEVLQNGACITPTPTCILPQVLENGACVTLPPNCTAPQILENNVCIEPETDASEKLLRVEHDDYTLWLDCEKRSAIKFQYDTRPDTGRAKRISSFYPDPDVPADCQQLSVKSYDKNYERGHLVPANHLDYSDAAIRSSNYMTNILPQAKAMNRGAWLATEDIIECYRDTTSMTVIGGALYSVSSTNDHFVTTHGIETPEWFWKVIIDNDTPDVIAWVVPNQAIATRKRLDSYLTDIDTLEQLTGDVIPIPNDLKMQKPPKSWPIPKKCNRQ